MNHPCKALLLCLAACEPQLHNGAAVRQTLSRQSVAPLPGEVTARADAAGQALQGWKTREGVDLWLALRDAEARLGQAAASGETSGDARLARARGTFLAAAGRIAAAPAPLDEQALADVRALLAESREDAAAVRARDPTAVSPATSLRALRKHQESETHLAY